MRLRLVEFFHELGELRLERRADGGKLHRALRRARAAVTDGAVTARLARLLLRREHLAQQGLFGIAQQFLVIDDHEILVLLQEVVALVCHLARVVVQRKRRRRPLRFLEAALILQRAVQLLRELLVRRRREHARLVQ